MANRYDIFARDKTSERWVCVATNLSADFSKWEAKQYQRVYSHVARVRAGHAPDDPSADYRQRSVDYGSAGQAGGFNGNVKGTHSLAKLIMNKCEWILRF